jgi:hypothetical protein
MPDVGGKKFSYTPEGRKAAKAYSKRTGKAVSTNYRGGKTVAKKRKKAGGSIKRMQGGGLSAAQQNLLRGAQEHAARSGQNPGRLQQLTAQHGDLYGASQQRKARSQMAGNQPGRTSMRGIGPGMKKGGKVPSYNDLIRSKGW